VWELCQLDERHLDLVHRQSMSASPRLALAYESWTYHPERLAIGARWLCRHGTHREVVKAGLALLGISGTTDDVEMIVRLGLLEELTLRPQDQGPAHFQVFPQSPPVGLEPTTPSLQIRPGRELDRRPRVDNPHMKPDRESHSTGDVDGRRTVAPISDRTFEAAAKFERAFGAAERAGPSPNVHPRVHEAMVEAMRSELAVLREQLDDL
jgi:hypothetical protein